MIRPITLIEHARKILTKIITRRLNTVLAKYKILDPTNHVALPNIFTTILIQILYIIEDANINITSY